MSQFMPNIMDLLYLVPAILLALTVHEYAHAYISYRLGDPTPATDGRLSLNPLHHLDPMGTLMLLLFRFGWAKPVIVNPGYYKNPKQGMALVAAAGPVANFILAFISMLVLTVLQKLGISESPVTAAVVRFFLMLLFINVGLGIFNLIPVPPLDGSKIVGALLPNRTYMKFMELSRYGFLLVIALIFSGAFNGPLVWARSAVVNGLQWMADTVTFFL
ncbi:site-2 protease family protein [Peptococcus niger]|uniref:Zn-dependent protease (Includes SpoIVFB) n=1 Tax=Peptococcus niger TaxID=2741 RepID=A0A1G7A734_PEPNI|nr:site-2 protease family protein [Peptococcus niger]SDE10581.1 Zn-dependent protease (includes SpoIVFB) [Peptococcus niger]